MTMAEPYIELRDRYFKLWNEVMKMEPDIYFRRGDDNHRERELIVSELKLYGYYLDYYVPTSGNNYNSNPYFWKVIPGTIQIFNEGE